MLASSLAYISPPLSLFYPKVHHCMRLTRLLQMHNVIRPYVCHDSSICAACLIDTRNMMHPYVPRLIYISPMNSGSFAQRDLNDETSNGFLPPCNIFVGFGISQVGDLIARSIVEKGLISSIFFCALCLQNFFAGECLLECNGTLIVRAAVCCSVLQYLLECDPKS